jgi:hypothetical protein
MLLVIQIQLHDAHYFVFYISIKHLAIICFFIPTNDVQLSVMFALLLLLQLNSSLLFASTANIS